MEKKLSVNNLVISFRTPAGKVQAVRNISFDLHKGETLAIVGESGSGKSVTSKAILGILAGNSIIEGGSILYDGMDLLKISEDDFYHIRGDKIAMIFQDPLSSLNPIMRIGKQLTEAMLLKGKARMKSSKKNFDSALAVLEKAMEQAPDTKSDSGLIKQMCASYRESLMSGVKLEQAYMSAREAAAEAADETEDILFHIEKKAFTDRKYTINELIRLCRNSINKDVVDDEAQMLSLVRRLSGLGGELKANEDYPETTEVLKKIRDVLQKALAKDEPVLFSMDTEGLRKAVIGGISNSAGMYLQKKKEALAVLREARKVFEADWLVKEEIKSAQEKACRAVEDSIDPCEIRKDGLAYTFRSSLSGNAKAYFEGREKNKKALKQHEKQQEKYDSLVKAGKTPSWKVVPSQAVDLDVIKETLLDIIDRMTAHYEEIIENFKNRDYGAQADDIFSYLKENAVGQVQRITKSMAKYKALKLMEEVGISDVRRRYKQYPFEFSGGMRQRIVIAIALAADPDILICDEPTTALDVTIQAQILELINRIKRDRKLSVIFITHDLGVVANMADRIAVMYAGKIVETGTSRDVFYSPAHPYTWALLSAMPDTETNERLIAIPGTPPNMIYPPQGDAFAERNRYALKIDFKRQPPMFKISDTHYAATWLLHPDAPKVEMPAVIAARIESMKKKRGGANG